MNLINVRYKIVSTFEYHHFMLSSHQNTQIRQPILRGYPAKRALPTILTHGPFGRIPSTSLVADVFKDATSP